MKFMCNGMLGKLCRYLRICGIDTTYSDQGIKALIVAKRENRIFLTRNTNLKKKENVFFISSENLFEQLNEIICKFNLTEEINFFSRCLCCNERLLAVDKERVRELVPFYTYKNFDEFAECPRCKRIYWKGSHYKKMVETIKKYIV